MKSNLAKDIIPVSDLMHGAGEVIKKLKKNRRPVLITQNGRAAMVCLDVQEYQSQLRRLEMIDAVLTGESAVARGRFTSWDEFEDELDDL